MLQTKRALGEFSLTALFFWLGLFELFNPSAPGVELLRADLVLAQRIVVARTVEIDEVRRAAVVQNGQLLTQRAFPNRLELHVAVAAVVQGFFGNNALRAGGRGAETDDAVRAGANAGDFRESAAACRS